MKISVQHDLAPADGLVVFLPEKKWSSAVSKTFGKILPTSLTKEIQKRLEDQDFSGELGEVLQVFVPVPKIKKVFLVGLGKGESLGEQRKAAASAIAHMQKGKLKNLLFLIPDNIDAARVASGAILGMYQFKVGDISKHFTPTSLTLVTHNAKEDKKAVQSAVSCAEGVNYTRNLVNLPPNQMTPKILAEEARKLAKRSGGKVKIKVLGEKEMKKLGMNALLAVGQGSDEESQMIILEYNGGKKTEKPLALIGKGVCFDSGGYNLKPTKYIEDMKSDMAGGASVLGAFSWIIDQKPKTNVLGVIGAVENLVSGNAFKAGDIITSMKGSTMEITNTDAEGRMVLADCLHYVVTKYAPRGIYDLATLTGSVIVALGYNTAGVFTNNRPLLHKLEKASEKADEKVWELPVTDEFREKMKGHVSDLYNCDLGRGAGASTAAAFLEHFVGKTPWVHIDIGGAAFHAQKEDAITPKGATGSMVRTLCALLEA